MVRFLKYVGWWCTRRASLIEESRARAKQEACKHIGWNTGHVCCPSCGVEDGC